MTTTPSSNLFGPRAARAAARLLAALAAAAALHGCAANYDDGEELYDDEDYGSVTSNIAVSGRWTLPTSVRQAGEAQRVDYDGAPRWEGGRNCGGRFLPGSRELGDYLRAHFAGVTSYGGYSCRPNTASPWLTSMHGTGRAIDVFVRTDGGSADNTRGDKVANWLVTHASEIGVQYIIWDRTQWSGSRAGRKDRRYGGPHPHHDHLHVELTVEGANRRTRWFRDHGAPPSDDCSGSASGRSPIWTCTDNGAARERCANNRVETQRCPGGCVRQPSGTPDDCATGGGASCAGSASGASGIWTCTDNGRARQRCVNGRVETDNCPAGCVRKPSGTPDVCRDVTTCAGSASGTSPIWTCTPEGDARERCVNGRVEVDRCEDNGCLRRPSGTNDTCRLYTSTNGCGASASGRSPIWTCTSDLRARQRCVDGKTHTDRCEGRCVRQPSGTHDDCT